ncbi:hypothetical protein RQP53_22455 [Paucibacter sp. APW11]|uniref:VCBS repeat-containing protein n=1 Tax=Roseateles aquae TaxID=3077235 RepID=A0ABU3PHM7_9BURK|nr:hypothetical protein [Paucibacter sp. APW11]MDT9002057.1 hypothetical protein [Paucibacter sp. APW11]
MQPLALALAGMLLALAAPSLAASSAEGRAAAAAAAKLAPGVRWQADSLLRADIDCDGHDDLILLGKGQDELVLLILPDHWHKKPLWWRQPWRDIALADLQLSVEPLDVSDREFANMQGFVPEGYRRSSSCRGLLLNQGEIDPLHFYWNHQRGQLSFWSL